MSTRIAVIGTGFTPNGNREPTPEIAAVVGAGVKAELIETRLSVFPGTPYERGLCAIGYIEAGIRAQDEGFDAVFINTFGDYGIDELKSALKIPVVGAGEASMSMASMLGRAFAIVTIWPPQLNFIYEERVRNCGMTDRCVGVFNVLQDEELEKGRDSDPVADMRAGKRSMIERILIVAKQAMASGADTIALGCTCMAPIGQKIADQLPIPVIEAATAGYKYTELLASLRLKHSAGAHPPVAADRLSIARKLVNGGDGAPLQEKECEVCVEAAE